MVNHQIMVKLMVTYEELDLPLLDNQHNSMLKLSSW